MICKALWILTVFIDVAAAVSVKGYGEVPLENVMVDAAKDHPNAFNFFRNSTKGTVIRTEYDILMTPKQYDELYAPDRKKRTVGIKESLWEKYWTNKVVHYRFADNTFPQSTITLIKQAIDEWAHYTCIKFKEDVSRSKYNHIKIIKDDGCYSYVGMINGPQELSIGEGCQYKETVLHEFGHALGLYHEQNHPERDNHLEIVEDNIPSNIISNFRKQPHHSVVDFDIPYDYLSIMHYSGTAFGDGNLTMRTIDPKMQNVIGLQHDLSFGDVKIVNKMYQCKPSRCALTDSDCPGAGFVGKDCKCWCEGHPVQYCYDKDRNEQGVLGLGCKDFSTSCSYWKDQGFCTDIRYRVEMLGICKKTCTSCISE